MHTVTKAQPRCPRRRLGKALSMLGQANTPLITCQDFPAKCFPAKHTRALFHSATVCAGSRATVTASVQLAQNRGGEGGQRAATKRGPAPPCFRRKTRLSTSWGLWSNFSLGRKGGRETEEGEQTEVLSLFYFLNKAWSGHSESRQKDAFFFFS